MEVNTTNGKWESEKTCFFELAQSHFHFHFHLCLHVHMGELAKQHPKKEIVLCIMSNTQRTRTVHNNSKITRRNSAMHHVKHTLHTVSHCRADGPNACKTPGEKCWCGYGFLDIDWRNVAVAKVSLTSTGEILLWLMFPSLGLEKCCCG